MSVLRSRDFVRAAHQNDHAAIDADYWRWFRERGIDKPSAYKFFSHVEKGSNACAIGAFAKHRAADSV